MKIETEHPFHQIVGEKLSAVTFVLDYYQLQFDGPTFNVMTPITVISDELTTKSGNNQFRNHLCEQIGKIVKVLELIDGQFLSIQFEDDTEVQLSLSPSDYQGSEALYFNGLNKEMIVI